MVGLLLLLAVIVCMPTTFMGDCCGAGPPPELPWGDGCTMMLMLCMLTLFTLLNVVVVAWGMVVVVVAVEFWLFF